MNTPEKCKKCLRISPNHRSCSAMTHLQENCFAFIDDSVEFKKRQRERAVHVTSVGCNNGGKETALRKEMLA